MRRYALLVCFLAIAAIVKAQDGYTHLFIRGGAVYKHAAQASIGFDFASQYHRAYELAFTYYRGKGKYENYLAGINYKPVIIRNKNTLLRFRFGGFAGTDLKKFIASPNAGIEWSQSLSGNVDLIISNNNGYFFWAQKNQRWRITAEIGLKFPL
ncbi:MAG: hypothetical protein M5Z89_05035 [Olivibacter sp.]|nr:hypothetical protein [Olivibacter sp. UJ_SKK_5.1]